jgi:hypothetical protein
MPYIATELDQRMGSTKNAFVGVNHECVALVRAWTNAPPSGTWHAGDKVLGNHTLTRGTVIATFVDGHYDGHAAIYLGENTEGIQVYDQWNGQVAHTRTIYSTGSRAFVNTADNYHVVQ